MKAEIEEMDKCVKCLALELPGPVHDDVLRIWTNLKDAIEDEQNPNNAWHD
jgi:hypothetical protein